MIIEETKSSETKKCQRWAKAMTWTSVVLALVSLGATIGWLNSYPPMAPDVSAIATAISALATVGLAIFAILAWLSSQNTIETMRDQIATQSKDTSRQIKHSRRMAEKARQTETLASLIVSLSRVRAAILSAPESVRSVVTEMETTCKIWQMQSRAESNSTRLTDAAFSLLAEIVRHEEGPFEKLDGEANRGRLELEKAARDLTQSLYQGNKKAFHEEKAENELLRILNIIIVAYPHLHARIQPDGSVRFWRLLSTGEETGIEISERPSLPGNRPTDGLPERSMS
jgi:hypothetical protein